MTEPKRDEQSIVAPVAAAGVLAVALWFILKKPAPVRLGDKITIGKFSLKYTGPGLNAFINWGILAGLGDFNNGEDLLGGKFASGGAIALPLSSSKTYQFEPAKLEWPVQPILFLDPLWVTPGDWQTYLWLTRDKGTAEESFIVGNSLIIGPRIKISE